MTEQTAGEVNCKCWEEIRYFQDVAAHEYETSRMKRDVGDLVEANRYALGASYAAKRSRELYEQAREFHRGYTWSE